MQELEDAGLDDDELDVIHYELDADPEADEDSSESSDDDLSETSTLRGSSSGQQTRRTLSPVVPVSTGKRQRNSKGKKKDDKELEDESEFFGLP